jgi:hypothetical protein
LFGGEGVFQLNKWYMDCVAPDGTAVIAYWAWVKWGLLRLRYAAVLVCRNGKVSEASTLFAGKEPHLSGGGLSWQCPRLKVEGRWQPTDQPVSSTLLTSDRGNVVWHCHLPRASARVILGGIAMEGLGYAERLDMTLRPWHLPIQELCWGRFLSSGAGVVWIEWRGPHPLTLLTVNGTIQSEGTVGDRKAAWTTGRLELESGLILRDGQLGTTALARVPLVKYLIPRSVRDVHECKWLRRGSIMMDDGKVETGWAIDEIVRFGGHGT